ncbi:hypothetical protein TrCOL_g211 [Triparma columacea]|uniref:CHCH domain-containing protein n=1 Tax=Triparma columacea TaxID=722753 RepID=A0A9W7LB46_9STRA|nr:hypothetical protein TrCOL_g211 [Triparma columacea]
MPQERNSGKSSVFKTRCDKEHKASLKCVEDNYGSPDSGSACRAFFVSYKECRRAEHAAILKARNPDNIF